ncbi:broad-complex core protein [Haematobia irritans]|uniref:broad-complex core protein n=1 Tax=Haematobia irritans TaxID=7368 RepID=UPI003F4F4F2B
MDETQHFCLRWNNYQSSITSAFENLRDDEDFVDVTLACEGRSIKAHRVVLSACSPYFRDLLKSTPCKHPVILLQDVNFHDLHSLVEFIYHGEVNVHQKSLQSFLKTAEVLRVSGLTQQQAEETHSQLAQIQNLANSARTPLNPLHTPIHDESPLYQRNAVSPPPPLPPTQIPFFKRNMGMLRRDHNNSTSSAEDPTNTLKRMRGPDNGLPPSNNNSPDIVHPRSTSPQLTPTDFSTMKHNNNNSPTPKDEKRNGSNPSGNGSGNGNGNGNANANGNGNGITSGEKLGSLTPSPLARRAEDVKSEPMELVCSNNNEEHSNDSHGDNEQLRVGSVDCGKGSMSSGNDEEIENTMPSHQSSAPFLISPAESKLFPSAPFTFPMGNLDPAAAFASLNSQMPSAADIAASPQGGSTNLLGGVIVPGVNANTSSNHHHSTHALHHEHHLHQANERNVAADEASETSERHQREPQSEPSQQSSSFPNTPSPHHHHLHHHQQQLQQQSQSAQSPPPHSHAHSQFGLQQHPLSMLPTHHLHSHHDLSPSTHHHHHHLNRAPSPFDHHHLLQHRRSSLSPSPTGRSSASSAAGILASSRASELAGGNRLLLPLPLNACHRCDVCGKLLSTKLTLKRHKEQQHLQPLNNAVCNLCHKVFRTLNSLNNHKSIYHRRQKHHSYFHHASVGGGVGGSSGPGSRLHQSLSSLSAAAAANSSATQRGNDNAVAAAAAAAAAAAELLLSPIVGAAAVAGGNSGPTMQLSSHQQQSSPNIVKPCMDYL